MKNYRFLLTVGVVALLSFCGKKDSANPTTGSQPAQPTPSAQTAQSLLQQFLQPGANVAELTKQLKPDDGDYKLVFKEDVAEKAKAFYEKMWADPNAAIGPKSGQTELKLWSATTEQLQKNEGDANQFPGGYQKIAPSLQPGLTFYRFKFVKPGEDAGMAFDGLVQLNGKWRFFPKPWNVLR